jgi:L-ascorbate metabolism protein UlaG (beta-lactamase superfamily)
MEGSHMRIKYVHHSGFLLENDTLAILIDCCSFTADGSDLRGLVANGKKLYVLVSHAHGDHYDPRVLSLRPRDTDTTYIFSGDIFESLRPNMAGHIVKYIGKGESCRDDHVFVRAFGSTDLGVSFYIEAAGFTFFHAGDLNNWHWNEEETPAAAAANEQAFLAELADIAQAVPSLDALMFPVDPRLGKDYTRGAQQFLDKIPTGLFLPMHFWENYEAARAFGPIAKALGCRFAEINGPGDCFELS